MASRPPRLFIHLGPPKTATTALQSFMQERHGSPIAYKGIHQPRSAEDQSLCSRLYHAVCATPPGDAARLSLRTEILDLLGEGRDILISEEMFLVDQHIPHQEKISRLFGFLAGLPVSIVLCLRDPLDAVRSMYQELFGTLRLVEKLSFNKFLAGNQPRVFDYRYLVHLIGSSGTRDIRIVRFEDLVDGRLDFNAIFGIEGDTTKVDLILQNPGLSAGKAGERHLGPVVTPWIPVQLRQAGPRRLDFPQEVSDRLVSGWKDVLETHAFVKPGYGH